MTPKIKESEVIEDTNIYDLNTEVLDSIPFQDRFASITNIRGITLNKLGITSEWDTLKAFNSDGTGTTTIEAIRVHFLKIVLTIIISVFLVGRNLYQAWTNILEIVYNGWFQLCYSTNITRSRSNLRFGSSIFDWYYYTVRFLHLLPSAVINVINQNLFCFTVSGLSSYNSCFPAINLPESIAIVFDVNPILLPPPPPIPKPVLDANKVVQVPTKRQIQQAINLRNEFLIQNRTHIAAERVRLITEASRFVVWSILQPTIHTINIYERLGMLWEGHSNEDKLSLLGHSVMNELHSFANGCTNEEFAILMAIVPRIRIKDISSGKQVEITGIFDDQKNNEREVVVNLSDKKRENSAIGGTESQVYSKVLESISSNTDLIIVPAKRKQKNKKLLGYLAIDTEGSEPQEPHIYFSNLGFGFNLFSRAIFSFATKVANSQKNCDNSQLCQAQTVNSDEENNVEGLSSFNQNEFNRSHSDMTDLYE